MKQWKINSFTEDELALILYILNVESPVRPKMEIREKDLIYFRDPVLLWKFSQLQPRITDEAMPIYNGMMAKLNRQFPESMVSSSSCNDQKA